MGERGIFQLPEPVGFRINQISYGWIQPPSSKPRTDDVVLVAIHGSFAGGKTVLGGRVNEACQQLEIRCNVLEEQFTENMHLVPLDDMKRRLALDPTDQRIREQVWLLSHASEMVFLEAKHKQVEKINALLAHNQNIVVCLEAGVHVDPVYAWAYWALDYMQEKDLKEYLKQYQTVQQDMPVPDIVLAITASPDEVIARKKKRNRSFEEGIPDIEVGLIADISNKVVGRMETKGWPVVRIADRYDYANNPSDIAIVSQLIQDQIKQIVSNRGMPGFGNF